MPKKILNRISICYSVLQVYAFGINVMILNSIVRYRTGYYTVYWLYIPVYVESVTFMMVRINWLILLRLQGQAYMRPDGFHEFQDKKDWYLRKVRKNTVDNVFQ